MKKLTEHKSQIIFYIVFFLSVILFIIDLNTSLF